MGGAVAAGFAAKYPNLCASLSLVSPLGIKYKPIQSEQWLQRKYFGEYMMMKQRRTLAAQQEGDFYDKSEDSPHRYLNMLSAFFHSIVDSLYVLMRLLKH